MAKTCFLEKNRIVANALVIGAGTQTQTQPQTYKAANSASQGCQINIRSETAQNATALTIANGASFCLMTAMLAHTSVYVCVDVFASSVFDNT